MSKNDQKKELLGNLAWGVGIVVLALVASFARKQGYVDGETVTRIVIGATGLMIAWSGNRLPKTVVPNASAGQARRVAGWSLTLSGLVYAGLWAFAPFQVAVIGGCGAILAGMAVTFGYCLGLRAKAKVA
ncbi:MAG: ammonium transporter [Caulobacter sp.]